eukprot:gene30927-35982_t
MEMLDAHSYFNIGGSHTGDHVNNGLGDGFNSFPHGKRQFTESICVRRTPSRAGKMNAAGGPVAGGETDQTQGPMRQRGRGISICTHRLIQDAEEGGRNVVQMHLREDQSELLIELHCWLHEETDGNPDDAPEDANHYALDFAGQATEYVTDFYMAYVQRKEQNGWRLYFSSTVDPSPEVELPDKTDHLDLATIARLFHLPIDDACKKLGTIHNRLEKSSTPSMPLGKAPSSTTSTSRMASLNCNPFQGSPLHAPPTHAYAHYSHTMGSTRVTTGAPPTALGNNMHGGGGLSPPNMANPALQSCNNGGSWGGLDFSIPLPGFAPDIAMSGEVMGQHAAGTNRGQEEDLMGLDLLDWGLGGMGEMGKFGQGSLGPSSTSSTNEPAEFYMEDDSVLLTNPSFKTPEELLVMQDSSVLLANPSFQILEELLVMQDNYVLLTNPSVKNLEDSLVMQDSSVLLKNLFEFWK